MRIALINENSQAGKNEIIYRELKGVVEPMGHVVDNYGMYSADDEAQLTYVQCGILASLLLSSGAADFVVTGCGTGQGAMIACNSFPNVVCGHVSNPSDAFLFAQVNDGNCVAMPYAQNYGWGGELNLRYSFEKLFGFGSGNGYPPERVVPEQRNKKILDQVRANNFKDVITCCKGLDQELVKGAVAGPKFKELFFANCKDEAIKGIWCVPMYSNPGGVVYSDAVVKRFAALKPKAKDFRIFWDNADCVHHLVDNPPVQANLLEEAKKCGNENICYMFASTSKITFPGSGVAVLAASAENIASLKKALGFSTIGYDKLNQLRHVRFFDGKFENLLKHMKKHQALIRPKFDIVINTLEKELGDLGIATWSNPQGGYFISFNMEGCAKRIVTLCKEAGVVLTGAGASFPYGKDPKDENIRLSPTFPTEEELQEAMNVFVVSAKLAACEKLLAE